MKKKNGFTLTEVMVAVSMVLSLALVGAGVMVAIHFIAKFW